MVLAEYDVKQRKIQRSDYGAVGERYDIHFHPEDCRKELEVSFIMLHAVENLDPPFIHHRQIKLYLVQNFTDSWVLIQCHVYNMHCTALG